MGRSKVELSLPFPCVPRESEFSRYPPKSIACTQARNVTILLIVGIDGIVKIQFMRSSCFFFIKLLFLCTKTRACTKGTGYKLNRCKFRRFSYCFYPEQQVCMRSTVTQRTRDSVVPLSRFVR